MKQAMGAKWSLTVDCLESTIYTDRLSRYSLRFFLLNCTMDDDGVLLIAIGGRGGGTESLL